MTTITDTAPAPIGDLVAAAEAADAAARDAWQAVADAEHRNAAEQTRRVRAAWSTFLDTYRPDQLRQAVADAHGQLTTGPGALVDYLAAILRERGQRALAGEALTAGTVPPPHLRHPETGEPALPPAGMRDHRGRMLRGSIDGSGPELQQVYGSDPVTVAAIERAQQQVDAETRAVRDTVEAARRSVEVPDPSHFRVTIVGPRAGQTFTHSPGGGAPVRFEHGVAVVPADHPMVDYWRRHPDTYRLEQLFAGAAAHPDTAATVDDQDPNAAPPPAAGRRR